MLGRMLESVWHVGFLSKACAAATFLCGLYITITIFLTSDSETNEYLNYHHKHLFLDLNNSLTFNFTKGITALDLLQYYSDETADNSEVIFTHKALELCPQTSPLLGKCFLLPIYQYFTQWSQFSPINMIFL